MADRKEYFRQYNQAHRDRLSSLSKEWREAHPGYLRERTIKIKIETLTHYGGGECACVNCGESRLPCLSIDHINNNGAEERRDWGTSGGIRVYRKLQKEDYPEGYQTLCMNCQWIKRAETHISGKW